MAGQKLKKHGWAKTEKTWLGKQKMKAEVPELSKFLQVLPDVRQTVKVGASRWSATVASEIATAAIWVPWWQ